MATTPNGTVYSGTSFTNSVGEQCIYVVSDAVKTTADVPLVIYCHGAGGAYNQFLTLGAWAGIRNWLIDNGWAWVEGAGGGAQPWGNPASIASYRAAYDHVASVMDIGDVVPFGRSMGGLPAISLYLLDPVISGKSVGLVENSGVQNLAAAYASGSWTSAMRTAYGASSDATFTANSEGSDPMTFAASLWNGKTVLQLVGDADTTVPPADHGYAMRTRYAGRPTNDLLDVRAGGDHSSTNGSYLQTNAMVEFFSLVHSTEPPPDPVSYKILEAYRVGADRKLFPMDPWA